MASNNQYPINLLAFGLIVVGDPPEVKSDPETTRGIFAVEYTPTGIVDVLVPDVKAARQYQDVQIQTQNIDPWINSDLHLPAAVRVGETSLNGTPAGPGRVWVRIYVQKGGNPVVGDTVQFAWGEWTG